MNSGVKVPEFHISSDLRSEEAGEQRRSLSGRRDRWVLDRAGSDSWEGAVFICHRVGEEDELRAHSECVFFQP